MPFDPRRFPRSLWRAAGALLTALREEQNFRLQAIVGIAVVAWSLWLGVDALELAIILGAVVAVVVLELVNSAVERLVDMAQPRIHHYAAAVKNMLAAAVLVTALGAAAVIVLILSPYLVAFWPFVL